jgi:hypothetical protein
VKIVALNSALDSDDRSILLTTTPVSTFSGRQWLTNATGFFFERDGRLFLIHEPARPRGRAQRADW